MKFTKIAVGIKALFIIIKSQKKVEIIFLLFLAFILYYLDIAYLKNLQAYIAQNHTCKNASADNQELCFSLFFIGKEGHHQTREIKKH